MAKVCNANVVGPDGRLYVRGSPVPDDWPEEVVKDLERGDGVREVDDELAAQLAEAAAAYPVQDIQRVRLASQRRVDELMRGDG